MTFATYSKINRFSEAVITEDGVNNVVITSSQTYC